MIIINKQKIVFACEFLVAPLFVLNLVSNFLGCFLLYVILLYVISFICDLCEYLRVHQGFLI